MIRQRYLEKKESMWATPNTLFPKKSLAIFYSETCCLQDEAIMPLYCNPCKNCNIFIFSLPSPGFTNTLLCFFVYPKNFIDGVVQFLPYEILKSMKRHRRFIHPQNIPISDTIYLKRRRDCVASKIRETIWPNKKIKILSAERAVKIWTHIWAEHRYFNKFFLSICYPLKQQRYMLLSKGSQPSCTIQNKFIVVPFLKYIYVATPKVV